jgi:hypothetical protein
MGGLGIQLKPSSERREDESWVARKAHDNPSDCRFCGDQTE